MIIEKEEIVKGKELTVAYRSLRVEEGTKKYAEEVPCDEGVIANTFITRSLQHYE